MGEEGCLCRSCGSRYRVDFMVPDDLWARIAPDGGLLCGKCIAGRIEGLGEFGAYRCEDLCWGVPVPGFPGVYKSPIPFRDIVEAVHHKGEGTVFVPDGFDPLHGHPGIYLSKRSIEQVLQETGSWRTCEECAQNDRREPCPDSHFEIKDKA